ncbi:hypothetical protein V6L77_21055 [Pannonibacter sp. Pt2-lr]
MRDIFEEIHANLAKYDPVERAKELSRRELPKRFYDTASSAPAEGARSAAGWPRGEDAGPQAVASA